MQQVEGYDGRVMVADSPIVSELVLEARHSGLQKSSAWFRERVEEVGRYLAYEAEQGESGTRGARLRMEPVTVETGNRNPATGRGYDATHHLRTEEPVLLNILRSADEMVHGARRVFREAPVVYIDVKRQEGTFRDGRVQVLVKYLAPPDKINDPSGEHPEGIPFTLEDKVVVAPDPMHASASSILATAQVCLDKYGRPRMFVATPMIAAKPGIDTFMEGMAKLGIPAKLYTAAIDPELDSAAFTVPGGGDFGNLQHNLGWPLWRVLQHLFYKDHPA